VKWNGKEITALLDTGCQSPVIGRCLLPEDIELSPPGKDLAAANYTKIRLLGRMTMHFTIQRERYIADLAVTDQIDQLILGMD